MTYLKGILAAVSLVVVVLVCVFAVNQVLLLRKAHSTFDNYYAFRGCAHLIAKTSNYGLCSLPSGQTIKIVEFHNKWYLDGDLPTCIAGVCL